MKYGSIYILGLILLSAPCAYAEIPTHSDEGQVAAKDWAPDDDDETGSLPENTEVEQQGMKQQPQNPKNNAPASTQQNGGTTAPTQQQNKGAIQPSAPSQQNQSSAKPSPKKGVSSSESKPQKLKP